MYHSIDRHILGIIDHQNLAFSPVCFHEPVYRTIGSHYWILPYSWFHVCDGDAHSHEVVRLRSEFYFRRPAGQETTQGYGIGGLCC